MNGSLPKDLDLNIVEGIEREVFRHIFDVTNIGEPSLVVIMLEYLKRSDPLDLFLSSSLLIYDPNAYAERHEVQERFRLFCHARQLRDRFGIGFPSISLSLTKLKVRKAFQARHINLVHEPRQHPRTNLLLNTTWITGLSVA